MSKQRESAVVQPLDLRSSRKSLLGLVSLCAALTTGLWAPRAHAELSTEDLAKLAQNPVGNLISVPFQNNTNFNFGPEGGTQNVLNVQPVGTSIDH